MKNVEDRLRQAPLATPSEHLDRRMEQVFAQAHAPRPGLFSRPVALWQCGVACALFAACGYLFHASRPGPAFEPPDTPATVYIIQADPGLPRGAFDTSARRSRSLNRPASTIIRYPVESVETKSEDENHI